MISQTILYFGIRNRDREIRNRAWSLVHLTSNGRKRDDSDELKEFFDLACNELPYYMAAGDDVVQWDVISDL